MRRLRWARIYGRGLVMRPVRLLPDVWLRLRRWLPGGACVIRGHVWRGQFCVRCGEFYP